MILTSNLLNYWRRMHQRVKTLLWQRNDRQREGQRERERDDDDDDVLDAVE